MPVISSTRDVSEDGVREQASSESANLKVYDSILHENIKKIRSKKKKTN